jgi:N-acetylglucosaminyl-diphospho-decaprenol L-rhamnosyltransferase
VTDSSPSTTPAERVVAIVVNYRTPELTEKAVRSLLRETAWLTEPRVLVVDNASGDGSLERLLEAVRDNGWTDLVTVLASPKNGGYAHGINFAVRFALAGETPPDLFYVMNPDAEAQPGAVRTLVERMREHPNVGVAGSVVLGTDGAWQGARFRFPSVWSEVESQVKVGAVSRALRGRIVSMDRSDRDDEVDWISGCSMMIRRKVFDKVGLFDDGFFLYYEETDFCRRARGAGFKVLYVADSEVRHVGSVSTKLTDQGLRMPPYWYASRRRYFLKHHGAAYLALCNVAWALAFAAFRVRGRLTGSRTPYRPGMLRDFLRYNFVGPTTGGGSP